MRHSGSSGTYSLRLLSLAFLLVVASTTLLATDAQSQGETRSYEMRVHDPTMIEYDGMYYLYSTGPGIRVWRSPDMNDWERLEQVFPEAPEWSDEVVPDFGNHIWAPDIAEHEGRYYLYYSVSSFGRNTSAIGVATNSTLDPDAPGYEWVDHGRVVESVPGRDLWNAIDPNLVFDDEGTPWLTFGSFWEGMKLVRLRDDLIGIDEDEQEWHTIAALERSFGYEDHQAGDAPIEAPFIFKKNGYYYLFVSLGYCCRGEESTYRVAVGRSEQVQGPYLDRDGENMRFGGNTLVVAGNERWAGVGHNATYTFNGADYLIYHGYDSYDEGRSKLLISEIEWDEDGWPLVSLD